MYGQSLKYLFKIIVFFHLIYYGADYHFNHIYAPFYKIISNFFACSIISAESEHLLQKLTTNLLLESPSVQ